MATEMYRFARESCFPYLGFTINDVIVTSEEITHRIKERK
jgi:hypothetical protein